MEIYTQIEDTFFIRNFEEAFELIYMITFHQALRGDTPSIHSLYVQELITYITRNIIVDGFKNEDDEIIYYALELSLEHKLCKPTEELFYSKAAIHSYTEELITTSAMGRKEIIHRDLGEPLTGIDH